MSKDIIKFDRANLNAHDNSLTRLVDDTLTGLQDPLEVYIFLKKIEATVKESLSLLKDGAVDEAVKHGKGEHLKDGAYISVKASAGRWKFSERVSNAEQEVKRLKEQEKAAFKNKVIMVDPDTGEEIPQAIFFQGQETINVKVPKI